MDLLTSSATTTTTTPPPQFKYTSTARLRLALDKAGRDYRSDVVTVPTEGMMQVYHTFPDQTKQTIFCIPSDHALTLMLTLTLQGHHRRLRRRRHLRPRRRRQRHHPPGQTAAALRQGSRLVGPVRDDGEPDLSAHASDAAAAYGAVGPSRPRAVLGERCVARLVPRGGDGGRAEEWAVFDAGGCQEEYHTGRE